MVLIILACAIPLAIAVLAGHDEDGWHLRHFVYGLLLGLVALGSVAAIFLFFEGFIAIVRASGVGLGLCAVLASTRRGLPPPGGRGGWRERYW